MTGIGREFPNLHRTERRSRVESCRFFGRRSRALSHPKSSSQPRGKPMVITAAHITPLVALIAGILILIMPRLLNYIVAIYLIFVGLMGLNAIHHFIHWH
jgi:hypothetical protein